MKRLVCFIIAFLPATGAFAQASLEATVFNLITNQPLVGVVVHLENQDIGYAEAKTSNAQGKVFFAGLTTAGVYETFVRQSTEYNEARAGDIRLRSNEKRSVVLLVGPVREVELDELLQGFTVANDTMTPTFKLRRPFLLKRYEKVLRELYAANGEAPKADEKW